MISAGGGQKKTRLVFPSGGLSSGLLGVVTENLLANFRGRGDAVALRSVMKPTPQPPQPPDAMVEEWDNPAMTEFKRQEAEERVAFGHSPEARQWLEHLRNSSPPEVIIRVAPKPPKRFPFNRVRLPW